MDRTVRRESDDVFLSKHEYGGRREWAGHAGPVRRPQGRNGYCRTGSTAARRVDESGVCFIPVAAILTFRLQRTDLGSNQASSPPMKRSIRIKLEIAFTSVYQSLGVLLPTGNFVHSFGRLPRPVGETPGSGIWPGCTRGGPSLLRRLLYTTMRLSDKYPGLNGRLISSKNYTSL